MITLRPSHERGHAKYSWLDSRHTFSFANYYDPLYMGVSELLVINDDWVKPGKGFGTHPHRNMEIISYVLEGEIEHKDTMSFHTTLKAGEVQVMSAGTGIRHSEFNTSKSENVNFLQIWIQPNQLDTAPRYSQKDYTETQGINLVVSPDGRNGSLPIHQNAFLYKISLLDEEVTFTPEKGRTYYLHVARGSLDINLSNMQAGDGATIKRESALNIKTSGQVEALLFELP